MKRYVCWRCETKTNSADFETVAELEQHMEERHGMFSCDKHIKVKNSDVHTLFMTYYYDELKEIENERINTY